MNETLTHTQTQERPGGGLSGGPMLLVVLGLVALAVWCLSQGEDSALFAVLGVVSDDSSACQPLGLIAKPATMKGPRTRTLSGLELVPKNTVGPAADHSPGASSADQSPFINMRTKAVSDSKLSVSS